MRTHRGGEKKKQKKKNTQLERNIEAEIRKAESTEADKAAEAII